MKIKTLLIWLISGLALIQGCATPKQFNISKLAIVDDIHPWQDDWDFVAQYLDKAVVQAETEEEDKGCFDRQEYNLLSLYIIPPQESLPDGGKIFLGSTRESEQWRRSICVSVFCMGNKEPSYITGGSPHFGNDAVYYHIYDAGYPDKLFVIGEGACGKLGGSIEILFWNTGTGKIEYIWGCAGEEDGYKFAHRINVTEKGFEFVIYGIFAVKKKAYEEDRKELEEKLGFPVRFIYDSRYGE